MRFAVFRQEEFFERYEFNCELMLALSGAEPMTGAELSELIDEPGHAGAEIGYTPSSGYAELREEIARLHPPAAMDNAIVTVGAIEALLIVTNLLLEPGDETVCLWPAYQPLQEHTVGAGGRVRFVELRMEDGFAIDLDRVKDAVSERTRMVLLNVPHNPTGQTVPNADLQELARWLEPRGAYLVVDEVFREMRGDPPPSAWDGQENLAVIGSMSKAYALPGLRVGWLVANPDLVREVRRFRKYTSLNPGAPDQLRALEALRRRESILARTARLTEGGAAAAARWLADHEDDFEIAVPPAGGIFFPRLRRETPTLDFCVDLVERTGVLLAPGSECYDSEGFLRMGIATPDLEAGLERLDAYLQERSALSEARP